MLAGEARMMAREMREETMKEHETITVTAPTVIVTPSVPNYVQVVTSVEGGRNRTTPVDIAMLTTEQLRVIGEAWVNKLLAAASCRRAEQEDAKR